MRSTHTTHTTKEADMANPSDDELAAIPAGSGGPDDDPDGTVRVLIPGGGQMLVPAKHADDVAHQLLPGQGPAIYRAIAAVMAEVGGIGKTEQAPSSMGGYQYRGIETITRHLQTLCGKHGIVIWPQARVVDAPASIGMKEGWLDWRVEVVWSVAGVDGIKLDPAPVTVGIGRDNVDKGINKAMTAAFKYLLLQLFMVSDGKDDTDAQDYSAGRREEPSQPVQEYISQETHDRLRAELQSLPQEAREAIRAAWCETDPMTGDPFLPLEPDGKPAVRLLLTTHVPAVEGMIARARKGDRPLPGGGPASAPESASEPSEPAAGTDTPAEPETATERPDDGADAAIAKAEASAAEATEPAPRPQFAFVATGNQVALLHASPRAHAAAGDANACPECGRPEADGHEATCSRAPM